MTDSEITITDGPGRDELLAALSVEADKRPAVTFHTPGEVLEAQIEGLDEEGLDGQRFMLRGRLKSESFAGAYFTGVYDAGTRSGRLSLQGAA